MKKLKNIKHEKEFDTQTLFEDINKLSTNMDSGHVSGDTTPVNIGKEKSERLQAQNANFAVNSGNKTTRIYEPRPLTPDDDIYEDIIEQFASAPTKPKYWFEEFGDYWSCSCGHINKGTHCKNCGLERELLRSLFILHKPADAPGKLNKKLRKAKEQVDKEELQQAEKEKKRKKLEAIQGDNPKVVPIEDSDSYIPDADFEIENPECAEVPEDSAETNSGITSSETDLHNETASHHEDESSEKEALSDNDASSDDAGKKKIQRSESGSSEDSSADDAGKTSALAVIPENKVTKPVKKLRKQTKILLIAIIGVILLGAASAAAYIYLAAPALQYEEALQLQAEGKYEKAIKKYEALGDYKDSKNMIWECYIGIGDDYFDAADFEKAIETYNIALKQKESKELHTKIWKCHIGIGDRYLEQKDYEKALEAYYTAIDLKDSQELQDKVNKTKYAYIETYKGDRTAKVEQFLSELKALKYPGIDKIYDAYYAWHVKITANTSEEDYSSDMSTASRKDTIYFHTILSGGEPSEEIQLYYEVVWPNGQSQIYGLDSNWKAGSKITARFQYPVPLFGKEGTLTFKLYDKSTNEVLGTDSITLQK